MEGWTKYKIGDLCSISSSKRIFAKEYQSSGVPFFRGKEIIEKQKGENVSSELYISKSRYDEIKNKFGVPKEGDMLLTSVGTLGIPYIVKNEIFYFKDGNLTWFTDFNGINSKFLYYWFLSPIAQNAINAKAIGSTQKALTINTLSKFEIDVPNINTQNRIVSILSSLDDKIEVNRRINENLEQQAQALFKAWFVDFEPFKDGKFVDSELGMIPEGWKVTELGKITSQITEKVKTRTDIKVLSPITSGELILSEEYFTKQVFSTNIEKYIVVKPMQFAYNPARINIGSIGMNTYNFDGCVSPVYVVFECEESYQFFFDYFRKTSKFKEEVISRAIGGVRQSLSYKDFSLIKITYPPKHVVNDFNKTYLSILKLKEFTEKEIDKLTALRDTLLPKLMSGELKINDSND